jgi:CMP-N-acetylneuraminic acid synthetase
VIAGRRVLAVVPARGGSKGIPRKNLRVLAGESLVARAGRIARAAKSVDRAVLSTDDAEIAEEGRRAGLAVPFLRPAELATDRATAIDTWRHAWLASEEHFGERFDLSVLLEPTSPLRRAEDVEAALAKLVESGARAVATVSRTPGHFTPERSLRIEESGRLAPYLADGLRHTARQTIPPYYHRNGLAYAVTRESLVDEGNLMQRDCVALVIERDVVNVDEPIDLEFAAFLLDRESRGGKP